MHPPPWLLWPCLCASLQMPGTAMSHKAPTCQFILTHRQSLQFADLQHYCHRVHSDVACAFRPWWHANGDAIAFTPPHPWHANSVRYLQCQTITFGLDEHRLEDKSLCVHRDVVTCVSHLRQHNTNHKDLHPDVVTCASLLRQHANRKDLATVRHLHRHINIHAHEKHKILKRLLLYAYGKAGEAKDALAVFVCLSEPDLVSWNFVISSCAKHGESADAFQLFEQMLLKGHLPDHYLFASILSACCLEADLQSGKLLHARITASTSEYDLVVLTALVNMYGKCCSLDHAKMAFASIQEPDVVSWNAFIAANVQHGDGKGAIDLYEVMYNEGVIPNEITFTSILSACANAVALTKGMQIHAQIVGAGLKMNIFMGTSLINMYGKCGCTLAARRLFDGISKEDVIIWNAMIFVYTQNGQGKDALEIFEQMKREGVKPARTTFVAYLEACACEKALIEGKQMHLLIKQYGYESDVMVGTSLLNMYGKCGSLGEALTVFDMLINRNVVSWNTLIACFAQGALGLEALQSFEQMLCEGVIPDKVTFVNIVPVCANHATVVECKRMHASIANDKLESDENLRAGIANMYGKSGRLEDAQRIFSLYPSSSNVNLWTALIAAYDQAGHHSDAIEYFCQMLMEGVLPDKVATVSMLSVIANQGLLARGIHMHVCIANSKLESEIDVQNALFTMYGKCGKLEAAQAVFGHMIARDTISFKAMIAVLIQLDQGSEAIQMFWQMLYEGVTLDNVTFASILSLCGSYGALTQGSRLHACLHMNNFFNLDNIAGTALLSMYACCGCLSRAWRIFKRLSVKEVSTWTAMMEAFAFHGEGKTTLSLFNQMLQEMLTPDRATIVKLLSACSHAGLASEACYVFGKLWQDFAVELIVDHYNCMVDIFGRIGQVEEAEEIIKRMPIPPNAMTWSTLLGACRMFNDVKRGEFAALCITELEPENVATYISLSNIYAAAGAFEVAVVDGIW
eukprot:c14264_g1_i1 orf=301-3210(-)